MSAGAKFAGNWADLDRDDNEMDEVVTNEADGTRTVTQYYREGDGRHMKCERKFTVAKNETHIPVAVEARLKWKRFGLEGLNFEEGDLRKYKTSSSTQEEVLLPPRKTGLLTSLDKDEEFSGIVDISPVVPPKRLMTDIERLLDAINHKDPQVVLKTVSALDSANRDLGETRPAPDPVHAANMRSHADQDDRTVRVTNLPDFVTEQEVFLLFNRVADVSRHFLVRNKETNQSRGFAFITYHRRADAARAIEVLHHQGFQGGVLNVEWAKRKVDP